MKRLPPMFVLTIFLEIVSLSAKVRTNDCERTWFIVRFASVSLIKRWPQNFTMKCILPYRGFATFITMICLSCTLMAEVLLRTIAWRIVESHLRRSWAISSSFSTVYSQRIRDIPRSLLALPPLNIISNIRTKWLAHWSLPYFIRLIIFTSLYIWYNLWFMRQRHIPFSSFRNT